MSGSFPPPVRIDGSHPAGCECTACKLERVRGQAANYRRRLAVEKANSRAWLDRFLLGWLVNVKEFDEHIGLDKVTREDGLLDFELLESELRQLLAERPYLAAP